MESLIRKNTGKDPVKRKWTDREYHVQENVNIAHKDVKIYCDTKKFQALTFYGSHPKPHRERGLSKHYRLRFDPNIGNGICEIHRIPC